MNVIQKIIECRKTINKVIKDTQGFGYSYASGSQLLEKIRPKMDELRLFLKIETINKEWSTFDYKNSKGEDKTDFVVTADIKYTWINADEPTDILECEFSLLGQQDDISKAFGSGLTYAERYFILKTLQALTDSDDPDSRDTRDKKSVKPHQATVNSNHKCSECNTSINNNIYKFSMQNFERALCINCQRKFKER